MKGILYKMFSGLIHILYCLVISPIEYFIEVIYVLMYRLLDNPGYALFGVSMAVSFLVLPLYLRADAIQDVEAAKQKEMSAWLSHIRKNFRGDERNMMISAYYLEKEYRPIYALRGIFPLLLQIPFFIAAYHYLSHLSLLSGVRFWCIADLGREDAVLNIFGICINVLPILMTLINVVSGVIYTKGMDIKTKLQVFLPALVFLFLLYHSPSGLVLYWTMNNLFSLTKNFVCKRVKDKKRLVSIILFFIGMTVLAYIVVNGRISSAVNSYDFENVIFCLLLPVILSVPLILRLIKKNPKTREDQKEKKGFYYAAFFLTLFYGVFIPLTVVSSSPQDFINPYYYHNPLLYVCSSLAVFIGFFLIWGSVIYKGVIICGRKRNMMTSALFSICFISVINFFIFEANVGNYGTRLNFDYEPHFDKISRYGNVILLIIIVPVSYIIWNRWQKFSRQLILVVIMSVIVMSAVMTVKTQREISRVRSNLDSCEEIPRFHLSRSGKNVVVIMLDRAMGACVPFVLEEKPELITEFDGFTFYPNCISTGLQTNFGSPGLYGGYDYTTRSMTERSDLLMKDKHDQALRVMPLLFSDAGYSVDVADVPYAGYQVISDYSIFNDISNVSAFDYCDRVIDYEREDMDSAITERNFCFYSLYRCAPAILQDNIYDHARYLSEGEKYYDATFMTYYEALKVLEEYTNIDESGNCLLVYCNNLTHEPEILNAETYALTGSYSQDYEYDYLHRECNGMEMDLTVENALPNYQVTVAAFLLLGDWLDYLREEGVYDNTRIILVSDHGLHNAPGMFPSMLFNVDGEEIDSQHPNALLMVKDYNKKGFSVDYDFMVNADVPALAMDGIIENPVNPYTGNPIDLNGKTGGVDIFWSTQNQIRQDKFIPDPEDSPWYHVQDNIYLPENWSRE